METPLNFKRLKKRKSLKVKQDIESTNKILREDIYDILKDSFNTGKTKQEAINDLRSFLNVLNSKAIEYRGNKNEGIERVVSDVDSYNIQWIK